MPLRAVMPPEGVVRGATPELYPDKWFETNGVRFRGGQLIPIGGSAFIPETNCDTPPRDVVTWHANLTGRWAAWGTDVHLYAYRFDTQILYDITPAGVGPLNPPGARIGYGIGDYGEETYGTARSSADISVTDSSADLGDVWSIALWGQDLLIVPTQDGHLFHWTPDTPATLPAIVAAAPINNLGVFVTDERHAVLLGAGGVDRAVTWSDQENYTVWTPTAANSAGSLLLETEARPLTGRRISQGTNLIFTDNDAHAFKFVGPPYYYGLNRLAVGCGLIAHRAISSIGQSVVWMGAQGFFEYAGTVQPKQCDVHDWLYSLINRQMIGRIFGFTNPAFREHWFYWPDEGAEECNRYVAMNYGEPKNPWVMGAEPRTAADWFGAMLRPIMGFAEDDGTGSLRMHEFGWTDNGVSRVGEIYAESAVIDVGEGDQRFHVVQIEQDFEGAPQQVAYRFFLKDRAMGAERESGPYLIQRDDGLVDTRFSCRRMRMRIEAVQDGPFAIGHTRLQVKSGGRR
jgi:hypothetical protein